jgi:signal transduction histidine kinase
MVMVLTVALFVAKPKLFIYISVLLALGTTLVAFVTINSVIRHLAWLGEVLDNVSVEDDLPFALSDLQSDIPELSVLTRKFKQLLERLHNYRAMSVRRLVAEKRRADIISASISDGIFLLHDDQVLYTNPVAERILGLQEGVSSLGLSLSTLMGTADEARGAKSSITQSERCAKAVLSALSQTMPVEFALDTGDGVAYYLLQAHPISFNLIEQIEQDAYSEVGRKLDRFQANIVVVAQDVTMVRESQEAKGHFLGTLSHEVKTPVTSLMLAIRLLNKSIDQFPNPTHQSLIKTCVDDVERLRRLLDELLNVSRFDALAQRLQFQTVDLVKFLRRTVESFHPVARDRDLSLSFTVLGSAQPALPISFDPTKLAWAFANLLTNAVRHSPRGGKVETEVICSGNDWVEIRVRDHGPGIERRRQARIFDKFSPYYDLKVARSGSSGMGLSVAREIVIAHGGRIWVNSELGKGAEFCFTLPLRARGTLAISGLGTSSDHRTGSGGA